MINMQDFYKIILDEMNTAYALFEVVYGPDGQPIDYLVVEANYSWEKLLNMKGENIYGKLLSEIHRPEAFAKAKQLCDKAVISRSKETIDIYLERFKMWYRTEMIPKMHYLAVLVTDVTNFKNLEITTHDNEKAMAVHKQLFNGILDSMNDGVCLIGKDSSLLGCNTEFKRLFPDVTADNFPNGMGAALMECLRGMSLEPDALQEMRYEGEEYEVRRNIMEGMEGEKMFMCFCKKYLK